MKEQMLVVTDQTQLARHKSWGKLERYIYQVRHILFQDHSKFGDIDLFSIHYNSHEN